jgi:peptidyl-prolyl cis-trans isomerase B (cyclophilin B)
MKNIVFGCIAVLILISCNTQEKITYALIETEFGNMKVELYNEAPLHRDNFIKLANEGFYDDLLFHRVIKGFMIQGGDPDSRDAQPGAPLGMGGPGFTIPAEIGQPHFKGTLAGARKPDGVNPKKESNGSQFYIVHGNQITDDFLDIMQNQKKITYNEQQRAIYKTDGGYPPLDMEYTVFGRVVEGLEVIDKIAAAQTNPSDRPLEDIKMKVKIIE